MQACGAGRPLGRASYVCGCVQLSVPVCTRACPPAMPIAAALPPACCAAGRPCGSRVSTAPWLWRMPPPPCTGPGRSPWWLPPSRPPGACRCNKHARPASELTLGVVPVREDSGSSGALPTLQPRCASHTKRLADPLPACCPTHPPAGLWRCQPSQLPLLHPS